MARKPPTPPPVLSNMRLDEFQARRQKIDALFAAGRLTPARRQELLTKARDQVGITRFKLPVETPPSRAAVLTQLEFSLKRRAKAERRRERHSATSEAPTHG